MKFALVTAHNEAYQALANITWDKNKKLYAERHGYDHYAITDGFKSIADISWARTRFIIQLLESGKYDWVHAAGGDTMITNWHIRYEDIVEDDACFMISTDCWNINNDSFLARNTPECIAYLKHVVSLQAQYENHDWNDQICMIENIEMLGDGLRIVPQRVLNAYDYDQYEGSYIHSLKKDLFGNDGHWQPGDFLIQWPGISIARRIPLAIIMLDKVIK